MIPGYLVDAKVAHETKLGSVGRRSHAGRQFFLPDGLETDCNGCIFLWKTFVLPHSVSEEFAHRLRQAFDFGTMAAIARRIGVPHATVRNYFGGRLPAPEVLIKIANETNVSLNWLLVGKGPMYVDNSQNLDLGRILDKKIEQIVEHKLAERRIGPVQELGSIDEVPPFDIESALAKYNDPQRVMSEWFQHEGREYPQDYGVVFFQGWETFSEQERLDAVRDAKKVLDRTLRNRE